MTDHFANADPEHLQVALHHAHLLQKQKDIENANFDALESLLDYPKGVDAQADAPSADDMSEVSTLLQLYRPVDFDELVEERRLADKCGYVLCPRPPARRNLRRQLESLSGQQVQSRGKQSIGSNESWCSTQCLRRATFLRFQLNPEPAWLRITDESIAFRFPTGAIDMSCPMSEMSFIQLSKDKHKEAPSQPGAGVKTEATPTPLDTDNVNRQQPLLSSAVVERFTTYSASEPANDAEMQDSQRSHNAIEGYII